VQRNPNPLQTVCSTATVGAVKQLWLSGKPSQRAGDVWKGICLKWQSPDVELLGPSGSSALTDMLCSENPRSRQGIRQPANQWSNPRLFLKLPCPLPFLWICSSLILHLWGPRASPPHPLSCSQVQALLCCWLGDWKPLLLCRSNAHRASSSPVTPGTLLSCSKEDQPCTMVIPPDQV
jgi:hypothetical protein